MTSYVTPKKNTAFIFYMALRTQSDTKLLKANPTLASGDFKVSIDGGSLANLTTLPTVTPASGTAIKVSLSASEMNGDNIYIACIDAAGAEWCDEFVLIQTTARQVDDLSIGTGNGAISTVLTVNDGVNPIDGVYIRISTDSGGTNVVATGYTGALGTLTFLLDAGTYYVFKQLAGYNFTNPESMVVS